MAQKDLVIEVAKEIWKIGGKSPEHGNAVMDLLGEDIYLRVMRIAAKTTASGRYAFGESFDPDARV